MAAPPIDASAIANRGDLPAPDRWLLMAVEHAEEKGAAITDFSQAVARHRDAINRLE